MFFETKVDEMIILPHKRGSFSCIAVSSADVGTEKSVPVGEDAQGSWAAASETD